MISVIVPVVRKENVIDLLAMIRENAGVEPIEILIEYDDDGIGCPKMVKALTKKAKYDLVCFIGDDTEPRPNFLKYAKMVMDEFDEGYGLVGLNDNTGRNLPTHWLAHKKLLPMLDGEFFHTGYKHQYCDNELMTRCKEVNRFRYCYSAVVYHKHPALKTGKLDKWYKSVYNSDVATHDRNLFNSRKATNWGRNGKENKG